MKTREELRDLIERIDIFPVGIIRITEEYIGRALDAIRKVGFSEEDEKPLFEMLKSSIDNKKLRRYTVHFKGGSFVTLEPDKGKNAVLIEFDIDENKLDYLWVDESGRT